MNQLEFEWEIAKTVSDGNPLTFVVYGGGNVVRQFCKEHGLVYVTPVIAIKNKLKSFEKIKESIAFFGETIQLSVPNIPTADELFSRQVEVFVENKQLTQDKN